MLNARDLKKPSRLDVAPRRKCGPVTGVRSLTSRPQSRGWNSELRREWAARWRRHDAADLQFAKSWQVRR